MEVDLDKIQAAGLNTITPVLICNTDTYGKIALQKKGEVTLEDAFYRRQRNKDTCIRQN